MLLARHRGEKAVVALAKLPSPMAPLGTAPPRLVPRPTARPASIAPREESGWDDDAGAAGRSEPGVARRSSGAPIVASARPLPPRLRPHRSRNRRRSRHPGLVAEASANAARP